MAQHKVVVAGCGGMANEWLDYAAQRENVEVVGLVDLFEEAAKKMAQKRGLNVPTFTDLSEALAHTGANLVFDVTIPASHKQIATTALRAGVHVFGEKPMAETLADAQEVLAVANASGKRYSVMQNRRYLKHIRALSSFLAGGGIGKVGALHADFFLGPHFGGFRETMASPLILDMAIHTFDQARFLSGADPVSVYCHEFNPAGSWYAGNASAICIFEMSDGSVFSYRGSWSAQGAGTSWESDWRVTGSLGTALWDGDNRPTAEEVSGDEGFMHPTKAIEVPDIWTGRQGHFGCLDNMFDALEHDRLAETDSSDNIKSVAMVFGAIESAKTGQKVMLG
ncbi:Gfo/Idh/MocA family protein [Paenibacillus glycinis]|uniref:Gfo/Idh/MocA family oxidoreductase n=1 Tax=Paenibacillus glycinis TaxID=2697035 RepID=A0ABW9XZZ0_9BACL|nr:Gfo/Idh/MocA family oxidoreductase [Paenibacillus glycinis]NBD27762.1 Gfo/Idh/MocA family oxidoreductase [Paenibacillus glycinis]